MLSAPRASNRPLLQSSTYTAVQFAGATSQLPDYASALKWAGIAIEGDMEGAKMIRSILRRHATFVNRHKTNTAI
ncbi:MAG: hypothetical protein EB015_05105 [Methylocystaceae bacterium]|nr:hypothetical protein [Methylocystaceae bacterium]